MTGAAMMWRRPVANPCPDYEPEVNGDTLVMAEAVVALVNGDALHLCEEIV
jgi:hypothetical protein